MMSLDTNPVVANMELSPRQRKLERDAAARREDQRLQGEEVKRAMGKGLEYFETLAAGHLWYEGTGNDDPIMEHQWEGILFGAAAKRWILGDGMGLGKTRTAIGWLDIMQSKKVLIVCEANICAQFAGEVMELAPHRSVTNLAKLLPARRHELMDAALSANEGVLVVNFEIWRKDSEFYDKLHRWQADTLIVDEAHNIKGTGTSNYRHIQGLVELDNTCPKCKAWMVGLYEPRPKPGAKRVPIPCVACGWKIGDSLPRYTDKLQGWLVTKSIKNVLFTTGTPLLNSPEDLYAMIHLCDPLTFQTKANFMQMYCKKNFAGKWEFRDFSLAYLKPLIEGRFIARTLQDAGVTLPKQRIHIVPVDLDPVEYPKQHKIIRQISDAAQIILESGEKHTIMHLIALIMRKRQANVFPGGIEIKDPDGNVILSVGSEVIESVKIDNIVDNIMTIHERTGRRQVVFSQFKTALREMELQLKMEGVRVVRFDGDTPADLRTKIKSNFYKAKGEAPLWDVVLCNYKTGGTGLNLTAASVTHILDEEWNPGKRDQGYARTHRIGQDEETDVFVYRIPGTVDTWMANTIRRKERMVEGFSKTMTGGSEEMNAASFLEALRNGEML